MSDAMTQINEAWIQFNELLDSGSQVSIFTKVALTIIGIAIMILVIFYLYNVEIAVND